MSTEPRFSYVKQDAPKTTPTVVCCLVVRDKHGQQHAFKFDRTPGKHGAVAASVTNFTHQVHVWAQTQNFDPGEALNYGTSALEDPGAARLDPKVLWWGRERVMTRQALTCGVEHRIVPGTRGYKLYKETCDWCRRRKTTHVLKLLGSCEKLPCCAQCEKRETRHEKRRQ